MATGTLLVIDTVVTGVTLALDIMLPALVMTWEWTYARDDEISCPCCGAGMGRYHCRTCGFSRPLKEYL